MAKLFPVTLFIAALSTLGSCTGERGPLGSEANPVKLFFVPSVDAQMISNRVRVAERYIQEKTGYQIRASVPTSYVAVVEAFGTKRADVAALNTFGYILAHERYGAEAHLGVTRHGETEYRGQILAKADGPINDIKDIDGKRFAYVDPASTSGYLQPAQYLANLGITPSDTVFANRHDNVITMIYQDQVVAGATFHSPHTADGRMLDARRLVLAQFPDVEKEIKIIALTDPIPNDPIVFRKDMPDEMKQKIIEAFLSFIETEDGQEVFQELYSVTAFRRIDDSTYDGVRQMLRDLGKSAQELVK